VSAACNPPDDSKQPRSRQGPQLSPASTAACLHFTCRGIGTSALPPANRAHATTSARPQKSAPPHLIKRAAVVPGKPHDYGMAVLTLDEGLHILLRLQQRLLLRLTRNHHDCHPWPRCGCPAVALELAAEGAGARKLRHADHDERLVEIGTHLSIMNKRTCLLPRAPGPPSAEDSRRHRAAEAGGAVHRNGTRARHDGHEPAGYSGVSALLLAPSYSRAVRPTCEPCLEAACRCMLTCAH